MKTLTSSPNISDMSTLLKAVWIAILASDMVLPKFPIVSGFKNLSTLKMKTIKLKSSNGPVLSISTAIHQNKPETNTTNNC